MSLALLFHYLMLNMFRMLMHPSSGACDLFVISWVVLLWFDVCWCYFVLWLWWCGIRMQAEALLLSCASSWFFFTRLYRDAPSTKHNWQAQEGVAGGTLFIRENIVCNCAFCSWSIYIFLYYTAIRIFFLGGGLCLLPLPHCDIVTLTNKEC